MRLSIALCVFALLSVALPQQIVSRPAKNRMVIIFDPTIQAPDLGADLAKIATALSNSGRIEERTQVVVWVMDERTALRPGPIVQHVFQFNTARDGADAHRKQVHDFLISTNKLLEERWISYRKRQSVRASCIVSALANVSEDIGGGPSLPTEIVLISDMLEACSEWDTHSVDMEKSLGKMSEADFGLKLANPTAKELVNLSSIDALFVVHQPHTAVHTLTIRGSLRRVWTTVFETLGLSKDPVYFSGAPTVIPGRQ